MDSIDLPCVFAIDDDRDHLGLISDLIQRGVARGELSVALPVQAFTDPAEAIAEFPSNRTVILLLDYHLNDGTALDWLAEIVKHRVGPIILITGEGGEDVAAQGFRSGASDYLTKAQITKTPENLYTAIRQSLRRHRLDARNKDLASRLKEANETLERRADHLRSLTETAHRFVDDVAHEFRNPLTVIQMFAGNIEDGLAGPVSDQQREFLTYIGTAIRDLSQLIDDLLDSSRLKNGTLRVDRRRHTIEELLNMVRSPLNARASARHITLRETVSPDLPEVFCDIEKASRVLINLTLNAIKFSPDESIVEIVARRQEGGMVMITVKDQGPGIKEEELQRIRKRFCQSRNMSASSVKGFGLGLNIADDLIHLNFGQMEIDTTPGLGSAFSFTLCENSPRQILPRYLEALIAQDQAPAVSVLHVTPKDLAGDFSEIYQFMSSVCFPMDLIFRCDDDGSLLVIGSSPRPDIWMSRLNTEWESDKDSQEKTRGFHLKCLGTWRRPELDRALVQCIESRLAAKPVAV